MSYKVELTYFKQSGKYYTSGDYVSDKKHLFNVFGEVQEFLDRRTLPGLCKNHSPYYVVIDVPSHNFNFPHMCIPETWVESDAEPERTTERVCTVEEWKARNSEIAGSTASCYVCFPENVTVFYQKDTGTVPVKRKEVPEKLCTFHLLLKVYEKIDEVDAYARP